MFNSLRGLIVTLRTTFRRPVTAEYPRTHMPIQERFMGFPALTWDDDVSEPYCVGCMVCIRECPTQCMSATMIDNPLYAEQRSSRRKIVEDFEINLGRCILCGICVDVCNFEAIVMSHEHEMSSYGRYDRRVDLGVLLDMGKKFQRKTNWQAPSKMKAATVAQAKGSSATASNSPGTIQPPLVENEQKPFGAQTPDDKGSVG